MTETPIDLPVGLRWIKLVCRLGRLVTDSAADANAYPDLVPIGGTLTLAASPSRVRIQEADGRWRSVEVTGRMYTIRADGELVDNEDRVGVYIPDPTSPLIEPQNYTITAAVKPTSGAGWNATISGSDILPDVVDLVAVSSVGTVTPSVRASFDARLYALEQGGGGGGTGSGIELVSGTVTLGSSGTPIREFYATGSATINGVLFPAGTAVVFRRTIGGQWGYIAVDGWTATGSIPDPDPELITVTATAPNWTDDAINGGGTWTTPTITGVTYSPASGTATPGETVTVSATAQTGYQLAGTNSWIHSFPAAPSGPAIVQTKIIQGTSVTLDAAPTPGNLLVIGVGSAADPNNFTFSHGLTLDGTAGPNTGWYVGMASAIVQSGATATVTVTGMGSSPRLTVWELADVAGFVDSDTDESADNYGKSLTFTTGGDLTLIHIHTDGAPGTATTTGGIVMDSTYADTRGLSAHAHPATTGGTITWANGRRATGIAGGYA